MAAGSSKIPKHSPLLRRADYRPPEWLVPELALDFDLGPERIRVRAWMSVVRGGGHGAPLRLDGEGLKLLSVTVDGRPAAHKLDKSGLTIRLQGDSATIETLVELSPGSGQLGLFPLGGLFCTQCEPQGFRRITFFPDRPDVLTRIRTRITADAGQYPVLLANGNPAGSGMLDDGRHWAEWDDPVPKPSYLFALVAGRLAARRDCFRPVTGRPVDLAIWCAPADLPRTAHAMTSLLAAMAWDERTHGRQYDLEVLNLVAAPGYSFGAVEAKGLNIFDAGLLLADPETATDAHLDAVTALVGHEYFHNWSGNRVTIRDWFELGLKEGLTVFRDQEFCAALGSPAAKRIQDVRALRGAQFSQDAGPDAHPVRPESASSIHDLYTATVYAKGAELVRMLQAIVGADAFRAGLDIYFARHDGGAATCDALIAAMAEASGCDLGNFARWYAAVGTPSVTVALEHDPEQATAVITLAQSATEPLPIPLRTALLGAGGKLAERVLVLEGQRQQFRFEGVPERPALSINRGFSAPVSIDNPLSIEDLAFLAAHDDDPVARWEAIRGLMCLAVGQDDATPALVDAMRRVLAESDRGVAAESVMLPPPSEVAGEDPGAIHSSWCALRSDLGRALEPEWWRILEAVPDPADCKGTRALRNVALGYLLAARPAEAGAIALRQLAEGPTMTDRLGALKALADSDAPERVEGLAAFHLRWRHDPALLDQWFSTQALSIRDDTIETAPRLLAHPDFTLAHPTRLGAVAGAFGANFGAFHHGSGRGYRFIADVVLAADRLNPQAATSLVRPLTRWRGIEPGRAAMMQAQLERILAASASEPLRALAAASLA